jgi:hypothetical protein
MAVAHEILFESNQIGHSVGDHLILGTAVVHICFGIYRQRN